MLRPIPRIEIHSYIYIYICIYIYIHIYTRTNYISVQLEVVRSKHIVHATGFGAYSSICCKDEDTIVSWVKRPSCPTGMGWGLWGLRTWMNFNPTIDKWLHQLFNLGLDYLSIIPKLQHLHFWSWERLTNYIQHYTGYVITYTSLDWSETMLLKGIQAESNRR